MTADDAPLLAIEHLGVTFKAELGDLDIIDDVSLSISRGQTVALVGESGCGKSSVALAVMGLLPKPIARIRNGSIRFGESVGGPMLDLCQLSDREYRKIRGRRLAMIFQEPMSALNPVLSIGEQISESLRLHRAMKRGEARAEAIDLLRRVGLSEPARSHDAFPHQLSGGMRQRAMIAMAISCEPALLIADEPTTALDVTTQAQILSLLSSLRDASGMSILLISHDLAMVSQVADYIYVMYAGRIVEHGRTDRLFESPAHPYTRGLIACTPSVRQGGSSLASIPGSVPSADAWPSGCRFHPRCSLSSERAQMEGRASTCTSTGEGTTVLSRCVEHVDAESSGTPKLAAIAPDHHVACWEVDLG